MKLKKGDTVLIMTGKDRGKKAKILKAYPKDGKILVEGINMVKKHQKPRKQGEKGQIVVMPRPINASNAKLICPKCGKPSRIGFNVNQKGKVRICKKCQQEI